MSHEDSFYSDHFYSTSTLVELVRSYNKKVGELKQPLPKTRKNISQTSVYIQQNSLFRRVFDVNKKLN